jgi:polyhydroxyalkanoate synthase
MSALSVPLLIAALLLALAFPGIAAALLVWERFWAWRLRVPEAFDSVETVHTADGTAVLLARLLPRGAASPLPPVLLVHGLGMNRRCFSLDPVDALAPRLAELGRDVWMIELRGASHHTAHTARADHGFDAYAREDIPAALAHIRAATGHAEVDWVGFSMGGMLAYAWLGALGGGGVRRVVTVGSPAQWSHYRKSYLRRAPAAVRASLGLLRLTPYRWMLTVVAPLLYPAMPRSLTPGFRPDNFTGYALRRMVANAFGDAPAAVTQQFVGWIAEGTWYSRDGATDYLAGLARVTVPLCVVAGSRDRLALPASALEAYERAASFERCAVVVGPDSGASAHYDHLDLLFGRDAPRDVFPHIVAWISQDLTGKALVAK